MRVLVTGGAGFIGSHLVEALVGRGDDVTVIDSFDPYYDPARKERNLAAVLANIRLVRGDICDPAALDEAFDDPEVVVHLAARAGVRASLLHPRDYLRTNVDGTAAVLEAMRARGIRRLVNASSSSVYGARTEGPFLETDPLGVPASPYAASKQAAEILCDTWHRLAGIQTTTLRFFTVYGPRQRPDMAMYRFIRALLAERPITLFGDGSSLRDYTYVGDVVDGIRTAIDRPVGHAVFNIGNSRPVSLRTLVDTLCHAAGVAAVIQWAPDQPGDVPMTWADTTRATERLGFACRTSLAEGLSRFIEWITKEDLS